MAQNAGSENGPIYGHQLMTDQERTDYQSRMREADTLQERERIRAEHHQLMQERAREKGITLPDEPPERGGMGHGAGMDQGMGQGAGMGGHMGQGQGNQGNNSGSNNR